MSKPSDIWPSGTTPSKIIDGWGICTTCGNPTGSADLWQDTCPRCAELAALEREIGRAVIACRDTESVMQGYESRISLGSAEMANYRDAEKRIIRQEAELENLITRYRALLRKEAK